MPTAAWHCGTLSQDTSLCTDCARNSRGEFQGGTVVTFYADGSVKSGTLSNGQFVTYYDDPGSGGGGFSGGGSGGGGVANFPTSPGLLSNFQATAGTDSIDLTWTDTAANETKIIMGATPYCVANFPCFLGMHCG